MQTAERHLSMAGRENFVDALAALARGFVKRVSSQAWPLAIVGALFIVLGPALGSFSSAFAFALVASVIMATGGDALEAAAKRNANELAASAGGSDDGSGSRRPDDAAWRQIIDALPDAAIALDGGGMVLHHNALAKHLFPRLRSGQSLGLTLRHPQLVDAIADVDRTSEQRIVQINDRVPVERRIEVTVSRLARSRTSRPAPDVLLICRDLSEQDRLAQMRADFIANASHELRTPLASLRGYVETLQGPARNDQPAREKFLGIMASQAARMTRLIDDLLSLSRVEMRVHLPPKGTVDLREVAGYVAQTLDPLARDMKITISVMGVSRPARVRGEREELVQVVQNLVQNAIKYGHEGGKVEISVSRVEEGHPPVQRVLLAVADDGPGIAAQHLPRLTERFYRADVATSRDKGGTGLGLAIVKHIVLRHQGDLRIASVVGQGSTFSIAFDDLDVRDMRAATNSE